MHLGTFGTRVSRRMVGLFVACAVLPVAAALFTGYGQVHEALVWQRVIMLRDAAGKTEAVAGFLAEARAERVDLIVTHGTNATLDADQRLPHHEVNGKSSRLAATLSGICDH